MAGKAINLVFDVILKSSKYHKRNHHNGYAQCNASNSYFMDSAGKAAFFGAIDSFGNEVREVQDYGYFSLSSQR